ncbi:MAG: diacylglycerol/lipid kinase family protein [Myxococcota bacterium]
MTRPEAPTPRTLVVVNERAGGGAMHDVFRRVEHRLLDRIGDFGVAFTDYAGHATELAREALDDGVQRIVVAGGDGTVHEVVNGWLDDEGRPRRDDAVLGLLPGGTGGDLRKSLDIPDMDGALVALTSGRTRTLDVGRLTYHRVDEDAEATRWFVNIVSFGLGGEVVRQVQGWPALTGRFAYAAAGAKVLWGWRNPQVRLEIEGAGEHFEWDGRVVLGAVANGRFFGGGMEIAPDAEPDDGVFDVTVLGDLRRRDMLPLLGRIYGGRHVGHPKVQVHQATRVVADSDDTVYLDVDGEPLGRLPATFEIVPGALRVAVP